MECKPILIIYEEQVFNIGQDTFIDSTTENNNTVVFEDNGETGYFYALDRNKEPTVLDALHIYNVSNVIDKERPSSLRILWTEDQSKAFLSINDYFHALFDFQHRAGYCRNGFPEANSHWTQVKERCLTDDLIELLAQNTNNMSSFLPRSSEVG